MEQVILYDLEINIDDVSIKEDGLTHKEFINSFEEARKLTADETILEDLRGVQSFIEEKNSNLEAIIYSGKDSTRTLIHVHKYTFNGFREAEI